MFAYILIDLRLRTGLGIIVVVLLFIEGAGGDWRKLAFYEEIPTRSVAWVLGVIAALLVTLSNA